MWLQLNLCSYSTLMGEKSNLNVTHGLIMFVYIANNTELNMSWSNEKMIQAVEMSSLFQPSQNLVNIS